AVPGAVVLLLLPRPGGGGAEQSEAEGVFRRTRAPVTAAHPRSAAPPASPAPAGEVSRQGRDGGGPLLCLPRTCGGGAEQSEAEGVLAKHATHQSPKTAGFQRGRWGPDPGGRGA